MTFIVKKGESIPCEKINQFEFNSNAFTDKKIKFYQGDNNFSKNNKLLIELTLDFKKSKKKTFNIILNITESHELKVKIDEQEQKYNLELDEITEIDEKDEIINNLENVIENKNKEIKEIENQKKEIENQKKEIENKNKNKKIEKQRTEIENKNKNKKIEKQRTEIEKQIIIENLRKRLENKNKEIENLRQEIENKKQEIENLNQKVNELTTTMRISDDRNNQKISNLENEMRALQRDIQTMKNKDVARASCSDSNCLLY